MQISQTKSSCKSALKELSYWMMPEKVIKNNYLLSLRTTMIRTVVSVFSNLNNHEHNLMKILNIFSGQNFTHNISIISGNCVRTFRSCVGHLDMELSFLYVKENRFSHNFQLVTQNLICTVFTVLGPKNHICFSMCLL